MFRLPPFVRSKADPHSDIEIVTTGNWPGEKMHKELLHDASSVHVTEYAKIM